MRTITWDVDPRDWSLPGTGAIYSNIVAHAQTARSSSCTTAAAPATRPSPRCPEVIDTLRARGFGFATVSELLGYRLIYGPTAERDRPP